MHEKFLKTCDASRDIKNGNQQHEIKHRRTNVIYEICKICNVEIYCYRTSRTIKSAYVFQNITTLFPEKYMKRWISAMDKEARKFVTNICCSSFFGGFNWSMINCDKCLHESRENWENSLCFFMLFVEVFESLYKVSHSFLLILFFYFLH